MFRLPSTFPFECQVHLHMERLTDLPGSEKDRKGNGPTPTWSIKPPTHLPTPCFRCQCLWWVDQNNSFYKIRKDDSQHKMQTSCQRCHLSLITSYDQRSMSPNRNDKRFRIISNFPSTKQVQTFRLFFQSVWIKYVFLAGNVLSWNAGCLLIIQ